MPQSAQFFSFTIEGVSAELNVVRFRGREGMSELFEFEVEFVSDDTAIDFDSVIGKPGLLEMSTNDGPRFVHGIVSRFEEVGGGQQHTLYLARIVPALWTYGLKNDCCIYQTMTVPDVIKDILTSGGMEAGTDFRLDLTGAYPQREYIVQYRETDLDFVSRLMEEAGIFYFFEHKEDGHTLVLSDHTGVHADIVGVVVLPFHADDTGLQGTTEEVSSLRLSRSMRTGKVTMRSFNFQKNTLKLDVAANGEAETEHEHYDFDGRYGDEGLGKSLVKMRQDSFAARRRILSGDSNCRHMTPGFKFGVKDHPRDEFNADFLLTRVEHTGAQRQAAGADGGGAEGEEMYSNTFEAVPSAVVFRPLQLTEPALVDGPQTAVVTGPSGEEIYCDEHGRVKVQFHWDRYGTPDEKASCWIRVAQSHRIHDLAIPRIGEEVIVDFLEGDPDQPIITGRVYNAGRVTPYTLPADKTKSTFRTPSSPGGDGFNELRFEDLAGSEEVFFHAQKDMNIKVLNNRTQDIGVDNSHHVGNNETEKVDKNRTREVGENESITIGKDETISVGQNHSETIGKDMTLSVGSNQTISVGTDQSASIGGARTTSVGKADTLDVGAKQTINVGADQALNVGGAQAVTVSKAVSLTFGDKLTQAVSKDASVDIGGKAVEKVGKSKSVEAADEIVFVCGSAKIKLTKNGDIVLEGNNITVKGSGNVTLKGSKVAAN